MSPRSGESVTFYRLDEEARDFFGAKDRPFADLVVHTEEPPRDDGVLVVELKGRQAEHGLAQLRESLLAIRPCVRQQRPRARFGALLVMQGSAPRRSDGAVRRFQRDTGTVPVVRNTPILDLRQVLDGLDRRRG